MSGVNCRASSHLNNSAETFTKPRVNSKNHSRVRRRCVRVWFGISLTRRERMLLKVATAGVLLCVSLAVLLLVTPVRSGPSSISTEREITGLIIPSTISQRAEAELLVLRADGFIPNEITRPPGPFLLALHNHSSVEEISLALRQERGASMREVRMAKRQSKLREIMDLPPGRYVLTEANHPQWSCTIVIMPNN